MNKKLLIILPLIAIAIVGGAFIAYAYTTWNQTVTWNIAETTDFTVWNDLTDTSSSAEITSSSTLNLVSSPSTINYYIENDGNVPITVTGTITFSSGSSAIVTWTPTTGVVDVYPNGARAPLTLTLSGLSGGTGSATVSFTSIAKP